MNNKLAAKMAVIEKQFANAMQRLPVTVNRNDIKRDKYENHVGAKIGGITVWGVTPREYWRYLKSIH